MRKIIDICMTVLLLLLLAFSHLIVDPTGPSKRKVLF